MDQYNQPISIENSKYREHYLEKIEQDFGNFYIFEHFVVGEIAEGVHFTWELAEIVIQRVYLHFGTTNLRVTYVSNRINSYSVQAKDWLTFFKERHKLKAICIIGYNHRGFLSIMFEQIFSSAPIKKFNSLDNAIFWIMDGVSSKVSN